MELALKLVRDPLHFDLDEWLRIRDPDLRAPDRVTMADIAAYLRMDLPIDYSNLLMVTR